MNPDIKILIDETNESEIYASIKSGVLAFNEPFFGITNAKPFIIYAKDATTNLVGGITGFYFEKYIRIDYTWVDPNKRGQGLGTQLFQKLEAYAANKGCSYIQLDTFDFQARPFYEKIGFFCVGTIPKWIEGHDCHFMRKTLKND